MTPKNPKTTIAGILAAVASLLLATSFLFDGDPKTNPDWAGVVEASQAILVAVFGGSVGALGIFAVDANKKADGSGG